MIYYLQSFQHHTVLIYTFTFSFHVLSGRCSQIYLLALLLSLYSLYFYFRTSYLCLLGALCIAYLINFFTPKSLFASGCFVFLWGVLFYFLPFPEPFLGYPVLLWCLLVCQGASEPVVLPCLGQHSL